MTDLGEVFLIVLPYMYLFRPQDSRFIYFIKGPNNHVIT